MLDHGKSPKMSKAMIRTALPLALAWTLWAGAAQAQTSASELVTRLDRIEDALRQLTGTVEQLQYRNQQLEQAVQRLQQGTPAAAPAPSTAQYSPPPSAPPQGQYSPPPAQYSPQPQYAPPAPAQSSPPSPQPYPPQASAALSGPAPPAGRHGDAFDPTANPTAPGAPRQLGAPGVAAAEPPPAVSDAPVAAPGPRQLGAPLDLSSLSTSNANAAPSGNLPPPPPANPSATGAMQAALPPGDTAKDEFDLGYGYVLHKDYGQAENTFRDFLHKYPSDRLTPDAQYWLGESLFQDQQYRDAAEAFLAVSTKYETTARAPEALLRLGQSLAALGEKEAACASLGEVLRKYPRASLSVKQSVDREQKRVHC